jgi:PKD repeat protein
MMAHSKTIRWTTATRWWVLLALLANLLLAAPLPLAAQEPDPHFAAWPVDDRVEGWNWPEGSVALTIDDDSDPDNGTLYSASATAYFPDWDPETTHVWFDLLGTFDLQAGQYATLSGGGYTRVHQVTTLTVTDVNPVADTVSGTADPGWRVDLWICDDAGCVNRHEDPDGSGGWQANLGVAGDEGDEGDTYDIGPGSGGDCAQWDEDGDGTMVQWHVPNPHFAARPDEDRVEGWEWTLGATVALTIDDPDTHQSPDHTDSQVVQLADWDPNQTHLQFYLGNFVLRPGHVVTLTEGNLTKTHTVTALDVTEVNTDIDTVSGTAAPGSNVDLWSCDEQGCVNRHVTANLSSFWTADFRIPGLGDDEQGTLDIVQGTSGDVSQSDEDGDSTQLRWEAADPRMEVSYEHDWIQISGFAPNGQVTYTIFDQEGGHALFGPVTGPVDSHGNGWISSNLHHIDLIPGIFVQAVNETDGQVVSLLIRDVNLDYVGIEDDRASGTAEPSSTIELHVGETHDQGFSLPVDVDGNGTWEVDLAAAGHPIDGYRYADVRLYDEDGDNVVAQSPRIHAQVGTDNMSVDNFSKNADVTMTLYASPDGTILYGPVTLHTEGSGSAWVNLWELGIDLAEGYYITAYDHQLGFTKSLQVERFTFDVMNVADDTVSGTSFVDEWVDLHVESLFSNWGLDALTDEFGNWSRNYGSEDYDLTEQMWAYGWTIDDQGNWSEDHITGLPNIEASVADDWISGFNFSPNRPVQIQIYTEAGDLLADFNVTADGNTRFWADYWTHGIDLQAGMTLAVVDTETGKTTSLTLVHLTFDGVNYDTETAWGQAVDGTQVVVRADRLFEHYELAVIADESGKWSASFASLGVDLTPEWSLRALVFDPELDATVADAPRPPEFTAALDENWVSGNNWTPNATVQIEVFESQGGSPVGDPITWEIDGHGNFHADLWNQGVELWPGQFVVVTDQATGRTKETSLADLGIGALDYEQDTMSGTSPASTRLTAGCGNDDRHLEFDLFSEPDGTWLADFGAHDFDLSEDMWCDAKIFDDDGDATQANWRVPNPWFEARPMEDAVEGRDWPEGAPIHLTIDDDEDPGNGVLYEDWQTAILPDWDPNTTWVRFELGDTFDLQAGHFVTLSDGTTAKTHQVTNLAVTGVVPETNTVSGTAEPGSEVWSWIHEIQGSDLVVRADSGTGSWTRDFSAYGLAPGTAGPAVQYDNDGDATWIEWRVPNPTFLVRLAENQVHGYEWPLGAEVTLTIDDPDTATSPDHTASSTVVVAPWDPEQTFVWFSYEGILKVGEGFLVTMTDGSVTKEHTVTSLTLGSVEAGADLVSGTAQAGSKVWVYACDDWGCVPRLEVATSGGAWSADFSVPGDEDWEQETFDISPGTNGEAIQPDEDGDGTQVGWWIPVDNEPPAIESITAPGEPVALANQPVAVSARFTDPDTDDTHAAEWDWGDDTQSAGTVTQEDGYGSVDGSHTYAEPGVYAITLTVTDNHRQSAKMAYEYVVVYDPGGGFVTGGGWIWSEAGWCQLDDLCAGAEGKASFGFVSKYKKGAKVPTGNTQFNFTAGGLNFHSDTYQWLVVNRTGSNAQYKGSGSINGDLAPNGGAYKFMLWARDEDPDFGDTFRIKIWYDVADGIEVVVYDNGFDQAIGGGSITIHTK